MSADCIDVGVRSGKMLSRRSVGFRHAEKTAWGLFMKKNMRTVKTWGIAVALACSAIAAHGALTYQIGNGGLEAFNLKIDTTTYNNALVGGISLTKVGGTDTQMPDNYLTLCTDISGVVFLGQNYTYELRPFSGQTGLAPTWGVTSADAGAAIQNAAHLFYNYYAALTPSGLGGSYGSLTTQRAALQLAVWSALYNTGGINNVINGSRFTASGGNASAIALANSWLVGLTGNYGLAGDLFYPVDPTQHGHVAQELLFARPPQAIVIPVPEASTIIAGLLLVVPFGASTLRILRRRPKA